MKTPSEAGSLRDSRILFLISSCHIKNHDSRRVQSVQLLLVGNLAGFAIAYIRAVDVPEAQEFGAVDFEFRDAGQELANEVRQASVASRKKGGT
jgi:hypothetical protein